MKTDLVFARGMGGESEPAFRAILPGQDDLERKAFSVTGGWGWKETGLQALSASKVGKQSLRHLATLKGLELRSSSCQKLV